MHKAAIYSTADERADFNNYFNREEIKSAEFFASLDEFLAALENDYTHAIIYHTSYEPLEELEKILARVQECDLKYFAVLTAEDIA